MYIMSFYINYDCFVYLDFLASFFSLFFCLEDSQAFHKRVQDPISPAVQRTIQGAAHQASQVAHSAHTAQVIFAYFSPNIFSHNFLPRTYQVVPIHNVIAVVDAQSIENAVADHIHMPAILSSFSD
jgi:hypothetical protein